MNDSEKVSVTKVVDGVVVGSTEELREFVLKVGPGGGRMQRFVGRQIGGSRQFTKVGIDAVRVYVSRKGKYVVHRRMSDWSDCPAAGLIKDWKSWSNVLYEQSWGDYTLDVVDTIDELRERIPAKIYHTLVDVAEHPRTENLDI
ncbi:EXLDI protein [Nocardia sp. NPDC023852]|uniref:EXLDI protein n=1 Tax=Nocardia sp. NPDC023852 TaxID=3154697 RepID=UPI003404918B